MNEIFEMINQHCQKESSLFVNISMAVGYGLIIFVILGVFLPLLQLWGGRCKPSTSALKKLMLLSLVVFFLCYSALLLEELNCVCLVDSLDFYHDFLLSVLVWEEFCGFGLIFLLVFTGVKNRPQKLSD